MSGNDEQVSAKDLRTVILSSVIGTTIEWYDFFLYGTAASLVFGKLFFPSDDPAVGTLLAFATFAVGFVARPIGGLVFGHVGDRLGRKRTLVATMMIMGVSTCLIGLVPSYQSIGLLAPVLLVLLRIAQGIAIGGEWGGAVLLAVEYARPGKRGLFGSWPQIGVALGLLLGSGAFSALGSGLDEATFLAYGWRIAFLLSAVLVGVGIFLRMKVMETPAFRVMHANEQAASVPALELLRDRTGRRNLALGMGSRFAEGVAFNTWGVFLVSYGTQWLGFSRASVLNVILVSAATMAVFIPVFGAVSDRWGRRRTFGVGAVLFALVAYPVFAAFEVGSLGVFAVCMILVFGVCYPVMYGPQAALYCELFPTNVRYTGISLVYQFSGIFASGLTPLVLGSLLGADGSPWVMVGYLVLAGVVSAVCTVAMRPVSVDEPERVAS
jgi:MFS family permease